MALRLGSVARESGRTLALTLTLSPGDREPLPTLRVDWRVLPGIAALGVVRGKSPTPIGRHRTMTTRRRTLPLPGGEGWGEGGRNPSSDDRIKE